MRDGENFPNEAFCVDVHWVEGGLARLLESFKDVRMDSTHEDYVVEVIKTGSRYIEAVDAFAAFAAAPTSGTTNAAASAPVQRRARCRCRGARRVPSCLSPHRE